MKTPTTHAAVRSEVLKLLPITELQYGALVLKQGNAYLAQQLGENMLREGLEQNALFWAWWRNHWHAIDVEFIDEAKTMTVQERAIYYDLLHDLEHFNYRPTRMILQDAFRRLEFKPDTKQVLTS